MLFRSIGLRLLTWVGKAGERRTLRQPAAQYLHLSLAPDDRRAALTIADEEGSDLWIADLGGEGGLRRLTFDRESGWGIWAPDGRTLIHARMAGRTTRLITRPVDGAGEEELLSTAGLSLPLGVAGSGSALLIGSFDEGAGGMGLWLHDLDRREDPRRVVAATEHPKAAALSPDGRWLAYEALSGGRSEVFLRSLDEGGQKHQLTFGGGTQPRWSPSGESLYYRRDRQLFALGWPPDGGFDGRAGERIADLGAAIEYVPMATGGRFLTTEPLPGEPASQRIELILGWSPEAPLEVAAGAP